MYDVIVAGARCGRISYRFAPCPTAIQGFARGPLNIPERPAIRWLHSALELPGLRRPIDAR